MGTQTIDFICQPQGLTRLGDCLKGHLLQEDWTWFRAAIAFVKQSGVKHIQKELTKFSRRAKVRISVGVDRGGTSLDGLLALQGCLGNNGELWIFHNEVGSTFHPKVYLFKNDKKADIIIGSGNLTEGGLFTNYEASLLISFDLKVEAERDAMRSVEAALDKWTNPTQGLALRLNEENLKSLFDQGYIVRESYTRETEEASPLSPATGSRKGRIFSAVQVPRAPKAPSKKRKTGKGGVPVPPEEVREGMSWEAVGGARGFLMTLQKTDVGIGQVTSGTSRRSPEIFIPLAARNSVPGFWGWPELFVEDARKSGKSDRRGVRMRISTETALVNMMIWPDKHDFRLRSETLRSAGNVGDILRIERPAAGSDFDYYVEIIPQGTYQYSLSLPLCDQPVKNSKKRWGYY